MADPATKRMSLEEFLAWDGEMDVHYQLFDGIVVAMASPERAHGILAANVASGLASSLRTRPECRVHLQSGVVPPSNAR